MASGITNVHISVGNSEWKIQNTCKSSYLIGREKVTWYQALVLCKHADMELASISSEDEEWAVQNATGSFQNTLFPLPINQTFGPYAGFWLAGTRHGAGNSDFVWLTTGKPVIYQKFSAGQPDNARGIEACLELFLNYTLGFAWNDISCDAKLGYICQSPCL